MPIITPKRLIYSVSSFIANAAFDIADFQRHNVEAVLQGPFSLAIDVKNNLNCDIYVGLTIETKQGVINITDRAHIGFCIRNSSVLISSDSIPQLATISAKDIVQIVVAVYRMPISVAGQDVFVGIRIEEARVITAPPPIIGKDYSVYSPGAFECLESADPTILSPNTTATLLCGFALVTTINTFRFEHISTALLLHPTPSYAGDTIIYGRLTLATGPRILFRVRSERERFVHYVYDVPFILDIGQYLEVLGDNGNPSVAYHASAQIFGQYQW